MDVYYAPIGVLIAHRIHINLKTIIYVHVNHNPTDTIYINVLCEADTNYEVDAMNEKHL